MQVINGKGVDDNNFVIRGKLNQAKARIICFLAQKLGIDSEHT